MTFKTIIGAAALTIMAGAASASTLIDFTDHSQYTTRLATGAEGSTALTGVWTLESENPIDDLTYTAYDGGGAGATGILKLDNDGVGVDDDEVTATTPPELIHLEFTNEVYVTELYFLDLFFNTNGKESVLVWLGGEDGGAADLEIFATDEFQTEGGYRYFDEIFWKGTKISFGAGAGNEVGMPDFSLAAIGVSEVPLPAAGWMLLAGLGGIAALRRGRKS